MKINDIKSLSDFEASSFFETNGYERIRIPGIIALENGDMLIYFECRRGGDWSPIDIGLKKSSDGGTTWSKTRIIVSGRGRNTMNNPFMTADGNKIHLFYCENYKRLFYRVSENGGESFSEPKDLTGIIDSLSGDMFWSVIACGPGHGVCLKDKSLIVPLWFARNKSDMFAHHPSFIAVLKVTDVNGGFYLSKPIGEELLVDPSECCIACLPGEKLLLNIRNENENRRRSLSLSSDGGITWRVPFFAENLSDPVCCAGMCNYGDEILFSNCDSESGRDNLSIKLLDMSLNVKDSLLISDQGGYSDVCFNRKYNRAFVVFENEGSNLKVARISVR